MSSTRALRGFLPARKKGAHYDTNGVSELISPTTITRAPKKPQRIVTGKHSKRS